jgi:hypothetical protein
MVLITPQARGHHKEEIVDSSARGSTQLISRDSYGLPASGNSGEVCGGPDGAVVSDGGRYVAFTSSAPKMHRDDRNGSLMSDVFVTDRLRRRTHIASVSRDGETPDVADETADLPLCLRGSYNPAISGNGRFVAFASYAPLGGKKAAGGRSLFAQVFVRDLKKRTTEPASVSWDGKPLDGSAGASSISISDNGRFVAFDSPATNLVEGGSCLSPLVPPPVGCGVRHAYVFDRKLDRTTLVSKASDGTPANYHAEGIEISDGGRRVVFWSEALGLTSDDLNPPCLGTFGPSCADVFVHDLRSRKTELVSVTRQGTSGGEKSTIPEAPDGQAVSADGRYVVFQSMATQLVPAQKSLSTGETSVYVRDLSAKRTERISVTSTGRILDGSNPSITDDARFVMYGGVTCFGLPCDQSHYTGAQFVHDRRTGQTDMATLLLDQNGQYNAGDGNRTISPNGRHMIWSSTNSTHVEGDTNDARDVFLRDLDLFRGVQLRHGGGNPRSLSADGHRIRVLRLTDSSADPVGTPSVANIISAHLAYRPQRDDLFLSLEVEHLGEARSLRDSDPLLVYGWRFRVGRSNYEVRAGGAGLPGSMDARFALFRCPRGSKCVAVRPLHGGFGTTGERIVVAVPMRATRAGNGSEISRVRAFSAIGSVEAGTARQLDVTR